MASANKDVFKFIHIYVTYGYVYIQGSRNGKEFKSKRKYDHSRDVVMHARRVWEATGIWPVVSRLQYYPHQAFVDDINQRIYRYKQSPDYAEKLHKKQAVEHERKAEQLDLPRLDSPHHKTEDCGCDTELITGDFYPCDQHK